MGLLDDVSGSARSAVNTVQSAVGHGNSLGTVDAPTINAAPLSATAIAAEQSLTGAAGHAEAEAGTLRTRGNSLLDVGMTGQLLPGQDAQVELARQKAVAEQGAFFGAAGMGNSSVAAGAQAQIDLQMAALKSQLSMSDFSAGLSALGLSDQFSALQSGDLASVLQTESGQAQRELSAATATGQLGVNAQEANIQANQQFYNDILGLAKGAGGLISGGGGAGSGLAGGSPVPAGGGGTASP